MKKFLAIALLLVLVASVFVVASTASDSPNYWSIDSDCYVEVKEITGENNKITVPTFKAVEDSEALDGLIVGLPTYAVRGDNENASEYGYEYFIPMEGCTIEYIDKFNDKITDPKAHIGTTDRVIVYKDGVKIAEYGLVTYGDADGDGVFDVIDAAIASLCHTGKMDATENPAVYEAMKPVTAEEVVDYLDYQQIVNDSLKEEKDLVENLKGRKIPIDQTLSFESVIYANDGSAKTAAVTAKDSRLGYKIYYNDDDKAPSASGIYSITAEIPDSETYLVTPGTRKLGFVVIAPKGSSETVSSSDSTPAYKTNVDNANKQITIDITKPNATGADLTGYINGWLNSAYNLAVSSTNISSSNGLATALGLRAYDSYSTSSTHYVTITSKTINDMADTSNAALGCYLPDDVTLWNDNFADNTKTISVNDGVNTFSFDITFRQNANDVINLDRSLFLSKTSALRGQRSTNPPESTGVDEKYFIITVNYKEAFAEGEFKYLSETGSYEKCIRTVVGKGDTHPLLISSLGGTGLKTVLVGNNDTISFVSAKTKAALPAITSTNTQLLYNPENSNQRYSALGSDDLSAAASDLLPVVNSVLGGLGLNLNAASSTESLIGNSGWCRYACADDVTGLRYTSDYYLEFKNVDATEDNHFTLSVASVDGCQIATKISASGVAKEESYTTRMTQHEPFRVTATLADGYKLSVKDASGNDVYYDAENDWYIMPASNVTVTAVKS